jgi:tetratricopeptide (TPR) repeat protein
LRADRAIILYTAGGKEEGFTILRELKVADPKFASPPVYLSHMYFEEKRYEKYFDEAEDAARLSNNDQAMASLAAARKRFSSGGEKALLQGELDDALEAFKQGRTDAFSVTSVYASMGRKQETMDYLEKAYRRHEYVLISVGEIVPFRFLHDDPHFQDLLQRIYNYKPAAA